MATRQSGAVNRDAYLYRLARALTCQRYKRVGRIGGAGFAPSGAACVAEDSIDVGLPGRAEPSPGIGCHTSREAVGAVRIRPLVGPALYVQPAGPRPVVGFGAGAHLPAPIAQSLHARLGRRLQQPSLGRGISTGCACDLGRLRFGQRARPERSIRLRQLVEGPRCLQRPRRRAHRLAGHIGDPVRSAAMPGVAPQPRLLNPTRREPFDRRTDSFTACRELHQRGCARPIELPRLELARERLESIDRAVDYCEYASPSGTDTGRGSTNIIRTYVRPVKPRS